MGWHAKKTGRYTEDTTEAKDNATQIALILHGEGWTTEAIAGCLGNIQSEGFMNPWHWQGDYVPTYNEFLNWNGSQAQDHGYGLYQFTYANKYINAENSSLPGYGPNFDDIVGLVTDGKAQTIFMNNTFSSEWSTEQYGYYYQAFMDIGVSASDFAKFFSYTADEYKKSKDEISILAGAFELCYERPLEDTPPQDYASGSYYARVYRAEYWYEFLKKKFPGWSETGSKISMYYLKPNWKRRRF